MKRSLISDFTAIGLVSYLLSIIKGRYGDSTTLLAVSGVAANLRFRAEAGIEAGFSGAGDAGDDLLIGGVPANAKPCVRE